MAGRPSLPPAGELAGAAEQRGRNHWGTAGGDAAAWRAAAWPVQPARGGWGSRSKARQGAGWHPGSVASGLSRGRSEERRGGEEGRFRGVPDHLKKKKEVVEVMGT